MKKFRRKKWIKEMPNKNIKFAFFGTSEFAVIVLEELKSKYQIEPTLIVTTPDQPRGRKLILSPSPVKEWAIKNNILVLQPEKLRDSNFLKELGHDDWDVFVVAAYGKIIPKVILDMPRRGALNIHPSLLPKYRGPSPLQFQILDDEKNIGVSIIKMDEKVDHGPIVIQEKAPLTDLPHSYKKLESELAELAAKLLAGVLRPWIAGEIQTKDQDEVGVTYTRLIEKEDGLIKLEDDPRQNYLKYLAYERWPGTYFFQEKGGKSVRLLIKEAHLQDGRFLIKRVVPEGKKEMDYNLFLNGA